MQTMVLVILAGVVLVLYMVRRRSRLNQQDDD
jgi:hypothetical protein